MGVAGEHLIAQREAVERHDKRDAHLRAVGAMIAEIAALRLRVRLRLAFEIGAGDVIEQHVVLNREQLSATLRQMRLQRSLVREQAIERAIEPVLVDLLVAELQQIAKRRAAIPILGDVQLARRLAEASRHQHRRHLRPGDSFLARRKQLLAQLLEPHSTPQGERQVDLAKLTRALDADALQANGRRRLFAAVIEQRRFFGSADQPARQRARLDPSALVELAKLRNRLLDHPPSDTNAPTRRSDARRVGQLAVTEVPARRNARAADCATERCESLMKAGQPLFRSCR